MATKKELMLTANCMISKAKIRLQEAVLLLERIETTDGDLSDQIASCQIALDAATADAAKVQQEIGRMVAKS